MVEEVRERETALGEETDGAEREESTADPSWLPHCPTCTVIVQDIGGGRRRDDDGGSCGEYKLCTQKCCWMRGLRS